MGSWIMTMTVDTIGHFLDELLASRVLGPEQMTVVTKELLARIRDPRVLAKELVQRGWLTVYQVNQLFQGNARDLVLGPYRIMDVLGEGGVAQVFRAWSTRDKCPVALKVVRREFSSNEEAVRQFIQEGKTIAALKHPNIVRTIEADQINGIHFLAMEFIEGIDLQKLVRLSGPLPIPQACDYIRQAALGLQHAHEKCLIHRDIKPANLFLVTQSQTELDKTPLPGTPDAKKVAPFGALIKILDWGLAAMRMPLATGQQEPANTLQREETIGTADYLAPEQAMDATLVDIRADIYSLGCSFWYLLTGQPPFPGGSLLQKLLKHREASPVPIHQLRPDIPPALEPILAKMMAKKPEDRYRTPASAAAALGSLCRSPGSPTMIRPPARAPST
jgi:serine/threonine-protein kinase